MRFDSSPEHSIYTVGSGIYVLYGVVTVRVNHGQLVLNANIFDNRSSLTLTKGSSRLTRLVILGHSGSITFKALRWLYDINAGVLQIGYDGSVIMASASPGPDVPKLRRTQALARGTDLGFEIIRNLIIRKTKGQLAVYNQLNKSDKEAVRRIEPLIKQLDNALIIGADSNHRIANSRYLLESLGKKTNPICQKRRKQGPRRVENLWPPHLPIIKITQKSM